MTDEERKQYNRDKSLRWRINNPDKVKEISKKQYEKNKDKMLAYGRKYYEDHADERRAAATAYRLAHRDECIAKCKKYHAENRDRLLEHGREYYRNNKEKCNAQSKSYRENNVVRMREYFKQKNAKDYAVFTAEKNKIKESDCSVCGYNRCEKALEFHHLDPSKKERIVSAFNTVESMKKEAAKCAVLCSNCHRELHAGLISLDSLQEVAHV